MPPFRNEKVLVDPLFDGEMLNELRNVGYSHQIVIVNAGYDIPRDARVVRYPGSSADAYLGIATLVPIDECAEVMERDEEASQRDPRAEDVSAEADHAFEDSAAKLRELSMDGWQRDFSPDFLWSREEGFHKLVEEEPNTLYVRTIDELPFACISLTVANPQYAQED